MTPSPKTRLGDIADIKIDDPDADFWIQRRGSKKNVGRVVTKHSKYDFGVTLKGGNPKFLVHALDLSRWYKTWRKRFQYGSVGVKNVRKDDLEKLDAGRVIDEFKYRVARFPKVIQELIPLIGTKTKKKGTREGLKGSAFDRYFRMWKGE